MTALRFIFTAAALLALLTGGASLWAPSPSQAETAPEDAAAAAARIMAREPLQVATEHRVASQLAVRFITGYHYHRDNLRNEVADRVFDQYFNMLDPAKAYFTADDIDHFARHRDHFESAIRSADLEVAFDIFARYAERVADRVSHAQSLLEAGFDFTVEEDYYFDRSDATWASDDEALNEYWRQRVKNDWLRLRLAKQDDEQILETLSRRYANLQRRVDELNSQDVFQFVMNAYTRSIEPHSGYLSPRSVDNFEISMRLSLDGIGAMLQRDTDYTTIMEIVPGGPADLDGRLKPGDRIVGVAQGDKEMVDVIGWRLDDVVALIRGERETVVRLEVLPSDSGLSGPSTTIDIVRNEVRLEEQAASSQVIELPADADGLVRRIGVIKVPVFYVDFQGRARNEPNYRSSTRDVRRLIHELEAEGVDGLVMDLRGNGGGALVEATTMTGLFIDTGPVVQVRDSRGRVSLEQDREPGMAWEGPLAVLVDRRSASASEILAGAIQDYGRGVVLGETTFGKGTVQNLVDLDNMARGNDQRLGQIRLTMAQFYRVAGGSTQAMGVVPDIALPTPGDSGDTGERALDFALPWGEIAPADFVPVADLSVLIAGAKSRHQSRLSRDPKLVELLDDIERWEAQRERTVVSLNEAARRAEMEAEESRRMARFGGDDGINGPDEATQNDEADGETEDLYLLESARILADLMDLDRDQRRIAHRRIVHLYGP